MHTDAHTYIQNETTIKFVFKMNHALGINDVTFRTLIFFHAVKREMYKKIKYIAPRAFFANRA